MNDLFAETPQSILSHHADTDAVDSFIKWRKALKKPLTDRAAKMIAKTLMDINGQGGDATEALDLAQEHGWQTIKSDWYFNQTRKAPNQRGCGATNEAVERAMRSAARGPKRDENIF